MSNQERLNIQGEIKKVTVTQIEGGLSLFLEFSETIWKVTSNEGNQLTPTTRLYSTANQNIKEAATGYSSRVLSRINNLRDERSKWNFAIDTCLYGSTISDEFECTYEDALKYLGQCTDKASSYSRPKSINKSSSSLPLNSKKPKISRKLSCSIV